MVSSDNIYYILMDVDSRKIVGVDGISSTLIKLSAPAITEEVSKKETWRIETEQLSSCFSVINITRSLRESGVR